METLSAPFASSLRISSKIRIPPPTVSGMKIDSAVRLTTSMRISRSSEEAVMSKKQSSSAPWRSYSCATSTGSPASRRPEKPTPLTTLPPLTSRQGIIRFASIDPGFRTPTSIGRQGKSLGKREHPCIEGLADDRAEKTRDPRELADILKGGHAPRCNQRQRADRTELS